MTVIEIESTPVRPEVKWTRACLVDHLIPGRGVAVLLRGGRQAALFRIASGELYAVGNVDPIGRAAVMSRGIVGDRGGVPVVISPLLKQSYSLVDGRCQEQGAGTDGEGVVAPALPVFGVRVDGGIVSVTDEPVFDAARAQG